MPTDEIAAQLTKVRQEMAKLLELLDKVQPSVAPVVKTATKK